MNPGNGLLLPGPQPPAQVGLQVAAPLNDVQLLAVIAGTIHAHTGEQAAKCVEHAADIVFAALRAMPDLTRRLRAAAEARGGSA